MWFAINWYRCQFWAERFEAAGIYKPAGRATSHYPLPTAKAAQEVADHINKLGPVELVRVVPVRVVPGSKA